MQSVIEQFKQLQGGAVKVSILALGIALFAIWGMSIYTIYAVREDMQRTLSAQQFSTASIVASHVNDELEHRIQLLTALASQLSVKTQLARPGTQDFLSDHAFTKGEFNGGIFVTDVSGTAIADFPVVPGRVGTNYMDRESVSIPLRKGITVIGKPALGKTLKAPIFSIVVPIVSAQGMVIGCVVGTVNLGLPNFLDKVANGRYGNSGSYFVHAPQYRLIVTAFDKKRQMEVLPPAGVLPDLDRLLEDHDVTQIYVNTRGVEVLVSGVTIPTSGWRLVVSVPTSEAFAPMRALQLRVLLAAVLASLLGCALTWWLLKSQRSALQALYDPLTHLANRRLLMDRLGQAMSSSQRDSTFFAVMVLDLDNFKQINDKYGHLAGDALLLEVASRLKRILRDIDTVARFGGDEFVVVLGNLGMESTAATGQAKDIAEKIRTALAEPYQVIVRQNDLSSKTVEHRCTVSIGVTLGNGHHATQDEILKLADGAMYKAKEAGRNRLTMA